MHIDRRTFLGTAAAAALAAGERAKAQDAGKKYKACVIGDTREGGYGHDLHMVWAMRPDVEVVGLADPDEAGRTERGAACKAARLYADYREMLEKEQPNLVTIGPRTTQRHKEYLLACVAAGAHGIMEKPLSVDLAEADEMISAVEAKNLKWSIGFNFRAMPTIQHLKKLLTEDKIIGSILEVRGRGKEDDRAGGEDLIVLGVHIFDLMNFLVGKPTWCFADITTNGKPSTKADVGQATEPLGPIVGNRIHATFGLALGIPGYWSSMKSRDGNGGRWGLDICGSQGVITIRQDQGPSVYLSRDPSWAAGSSEAKWEPLPDAPKDNAYDDPHARYQPIVDDLIESIEADRKPAVSIQDARDAHELIQAIFESHVQGGKVSIPLAERSHPLTRWT